MGINISEVGIRSEVVRLHVPTPFVSSEASLGAGSPCLCTTLYNTLLISGRFLIMTPSSA